MHEEYEVGYNDYVNSNNEGRKLLLETSYFYTTEWYWQGVKAAHANIEMEQFQW